MKRLNLLILVCLLGLLVPARAVQAAGPTAQEESAVCIMGAFGKETAPLVQALEDLQVDEDVVGRTFFRGTLEGQNVVLVDGGVGKVNAGDTAQIMFLTYKCKASIFTGIMGAVANDIKIGDLVVPEWLATHDWGFMAQALVNNGYVVQPGDTMSGIALELVADAYRYNELCEANRELLRKTGGSCHLIRPGWILTVPWDVPTQLVNFVPALWPETIAVWSKEKGTEWVAHPVFESDPQLLELARLAAKKVKFDTVPQTVIDFNRVAGNEPASYVPQIRVGGGVVTGDQFVWDHLYVEWLQVRYPGVMGLEMEGAAFAKTAVQNKIPFLVIRTASDRSQPATWEEPLPYWRLKNDPEALTSYIFGYQQLGALFGAGVGELAALQSTRLVRAILREMSTP